MKSKNSSSSSKNIAAALNKVGIYLEKLTLKRILLLQIFCLVGLNAPETVFADTVSVRATSANIGSITQDLSPSCTSSGDGNFNAIAMVQVTINGISLLYKKSDNLFLESRYSIGDANYEFYCERSKVTAANSLKPAMMALNDAKNGDVMNDENLSSPSRRVCFKS